MTSTSFINPKSEILTTKLEIPVAGSRTLRRDRLFGLLSKGLERRVTLLVAPTGYGKTTVLSDFFSNLTQTDWKTAWVSLDDFDNSPIRFWTYLANSLEKSINPFPLDLATFSPNGNDFRDFSILNPIINTIAGIPHPICLVLDDYQTIIDRTIHESVEYLIAHQPANLHIVLASRTTPPIHLTRIRAQDQVLEISASDLAFNLQEIKSYFFDVMALDMVPTQVKSILDNTEGWIIGIQLAALSYQNRSAERSPNHGVNSANTQIVDYFVEDVLNQQSAALQEFILSTSILNELSAPLCDAITGRSDAHDCLRKIEQANLFIVNLDEQGSWYRYHALFAGAMQQQLNRIHPEIISELHKRACKWLLKEGYADQAIPHARASNDLEFTADILESCELQSLIRLDALQLKQLIGHFSDDLIDQRPQLGIYRMFFFSMHGDMDEVNSRMEITKQVLSRALDGQISSEQHRLIRWEIEAIQVHLDSMRNDSVSIIPRLKEVVDTAPPDDTFFYGALCFSIGTLYEVNGQLDSSLEYYRKGLQFAAYRKFLPECVITYCRIAEIQKIQGQLSNAKSEYEKALSYARQNSIATILPLTGLLEISIEQNKMDQADYWVEEILKYLPQIENHPTVEAEYETGMIHLAEYYLAKRKFDPAREYLDKAIKGLRNHLYNSGYLFIKIVNIRSRLLEMTGELAKNNIHLLEEVGLLKDIGLSLAVKQLALARIELANNHTEPAMLLLRDTEKLSQESGANETLLECLILQAITCQMDGQYKKALSAMEESLRYTTQEGYFYTYIREGQRVKRLLTKLSKTIPNDAQSIEATKRKIFLKDLLSAYHTVSNDPEQSFASILLRPSSLPKMQEPLSERELEVLTLLAEGKSRKEVAASLMVSLNTIKSHTKNIYKKIGSHNRAILYQYASELCLKPEDRQSGNP
jgi:LuxR family maltose regulon positive regulatory protein